MSSERRAKKRRGLYHRYMFETKETLVAKVVWRLSLTYNDHVLDAYAIIAIGVVARLCLVMSFRVKRWGRRFSPLETVMPGFNGVLLYAMDDVLGGRQ
jgi:hypothetical protein